MVSEGLICVLVRIDGRHMYCQPASLNMSSIIFVLINDNRRYIETCRLAVHMSTIYTNQYTNLNFTHRLSLCSSMIRASHRRPEDYGFDSRQGLRKFF